MTEKIRAIIMIEMLGRPVEYIKEIMFQLVEKLGKEKGISIVNKKTAEPKPVEKADLFSIFSEVELEADNIMAMLVIIFAYMPSHVEIITPENLHMKNSDMNVLFNELVRRLHQYDEIAKQLSFERNILEEKLKQLEGGGQIKEKKQARKKASKKKKI